MTTDSKTSLFGRSSKDSLVASHGLRKSLDHIAFQQAFPQYNDRHHLFNNSLAFRLWYFIHPPLSICELSTLASVPNFCN